MSEEYQVINTFGESPFKFVDPFIEFPTNFNNLIVIGQGVKPSDAKADGDIIFGTEKQSLVISEAGVYLNGELQVGINEECLKAIRESLCSIFGVTN